MSLRSVLCATAMSALMVNAAPISAHALSIDSDVLAEDLANTLFLNSPGLTNISVTASGDPLQFGTFTNETGTYGLPAEGIVLSTGNVNDYGDGPNTDSGNTTSFGDGIFPEEEIIDEVEFEFGFRAATPEQEALLDPITGGDFDHNDVAQLTITFDAGDDVESVTFFGTFGSEEFPEFVGSEFIDGFGLFVNGTNVAFAGENNDPINVNHPDFLGAFVEGEEGEFPIDVDGDFPVAFAQVNNVEAPAQNNDSIEPGDPRLAFVTGTELDGVIAPGGNPVLRFDVPVMAGERNVFDIIIADTSDDILDSTIYLSSFQPQEIDLNDGGTEFTPLLPNDRDPNGGFIFVLEDIDFEEIFFIDPPVAVGYTYSVEDAEFAMIQAPSLATVNNGGPYLIDFAGNPGGPIELLPGGTLDLSGFNISEFTLTGINIDLLLDPDNPLAFPLGVSLQNLSASVVTINQTAITEDVAPIPLPGGLPLYLGGLAALVFLRRFRSAA